MRTATLLISCPDQPGIVAAVSQFAFERGGNIVHAYQHRVSHRDGVEEMVHKGRDLEMVVLARAVRLQLENRIIVYGSRTVVFD